MTEQKFTYIYGPVSSWRLGKSLGVDVIAGEGKTCSFDCVYCQVGRTAYYSTEREIFAPTEKIIAELQQLPDLELDYITFSGSGEPTLAANLGEVIGRIRDIRREKIALLTNASLVNRADVRADMCLVDYISLKIDAATDAMLATVDAPAAGITIENIIKGAQALRAEYAGTLGLQIMFVEENKNQARFLADIARLIGPDEVHINTPLRPCEVQPLRRDEISAIAAHFTGMKVTTVYEISREDVAPLNDSDTNRRRPEEA